MLPSDRILQQQYRKNGYTTYPALIHDLIQTEKHDELTLKIHRQRPIGTAPLTKVHHNTKCNEKSHGSKNHSKNFKGDKSKNMGKKKGKFMVQSEEKSKSKGDKCHKYG